MWRRIEGWVNYEISRSGNIRNIKNKRTLTQHINGSGYRRVHLSQEGVQKPLFTHILMWESFVGPIPKDKVIIHADGNKLNNRLDNLKIVERGSEVKIGNTIKNTKKFFTDEEKGLIQDLISQGISSREISKRFPVSHQWVSIIRKEGTWEKYGTKNL